jgi:hypothetical protein
MKNIIGWSGPTNVFRAQLRRRVSKIIVPLLKEHRTREKQRDYETAYAGLAVSEQLGLLGRFARSVLRARGFSARRKQGLEAEHYPTRLVSVARNRAKVHQVINFIPLGAILSVASRTTLVAVFLRSSGAIERETVRPAFRLRDTKERQRLRCAFGVLPFRSCGSVSSTKEI